MDPPTVLAGDLIDSLDQVVASVPDGLHLVLTTSWTLNYLPKDHQAAFMLTLEKLGQARDLTAVLMESPQLTPGLGLEVPARVAAATVCTRVGWRGGIRTADHLATAQAHGRWVDATLTRV